MIRQLKKIATRREFSRRTLGFGMLFILTGAAALFVDVDALMHYFSIIGRMSPMTLESGAIISLASAIPFLATGMSISADEHLRRR